MHDCTVVMYWKALHLFSDNAVNCFEGEYDMQVNHDIDDYDNEVI